MLAMFFLPPLCEPLKEGRVRHLEQESLKTKQIEPGASEEIEGWGGGSGGGRGSGGRGSSASGGGSRYTSSSSSKSFGGTAISFGAGAYTGYKAEKIAKKVTLGAS